MSRPPSSALAASDGLRIPPAERAIDAACIERLVGQQCPALRHRRATIIGEGWDNVMARLESDEAMDDGFGAIAARLPRREVAVQLLRNEQQWLPHLAPKLPLPIPAPVFCGQPSAAFDWPWSIVPWLEGTTADVAPLRDDQVDIYCAFFSALHRQAPADAPDNPVRSCTLAQKSPSVEERFDSLEQDFESVTGALTAAGVVTVDSALPRWRRIWEQGVLAPVATTKVWIAGDVHPRNVISDAGTLAGFIDFGDLTAGDRCTDLASLWGLFENASARAQAIARLNLDANERVRLMAWAIFYGVTLVQTGIGVDASQVQIGARLLARLDDDIASQTLASG